MVDNRIDTDGGFTGATIADDQFALAATDGNHGINRHDASEERLVNRFADHDPWGDFLYRIKFFGIDRAFAINGPAKGIDDATEQGATDGYGEKFAGGLNFVAFFKLRDVTEDDATHFVSFEIEGDADGAARKLHHLIIHDVGETVEFGDAIGDCADGASVLLDGLAGKFGDLLFDLFNDGAHLEEELKGDGVRLRGKE